ncbi:MAG: hypothetical protein WAK26_06200 [Terracidiphilus sp.]
MYRISKEIYGFELTFGGTISLDEMTQWSQEAVRALVGAPKSFGVLFDMRTLKGDELDPETQRAIVEGIERFKRSGMLRSCIILDSVQTTASYRRRARESRTHFYERYINASTEPRWRVKALEWIENQVDPYR